jgi:flagellar protein FliO/FliZ
VSNPVIETPEILSVGLSMLIIVGTVVAFGWLYSRMRISPGGPGNPIEIVASRGLGAKERLLLVKVGDQQLLVGVTAAGVTTLHTFSQPVNTTAAGPAAEGFAMRLRAAIPGAGK